MQKDLDFEKFIKQTLAVYKVTGLFPKEGKELQFRIRESANRILLALLSGRRAQVNELLDLFQVAAEKDWVNPANFLVLRKEYGKMQGMFSEQRPEQTADINNSRQKRIFNILKERKRIQLRDILPSFPQVSRRTLIRDLEELCQTGIVCKNGTGPGTSYIVTQAVTQQCHDNGTNVTKMSQY